MSIPRRSVHTDVVRLVSAESALEKEAAVIPSVKQISTTDPSWVVAR